MKPLRFTYLLVKFHKGWLEQFIDVPTSMVWVLHVTKTFAQVGLLRQEVLLKWSRQSVKWNDHVSSISNLLKLDMRYLFVVNDCRVMSWDITWKFWEIGRHFI